MSTDTFCINIYPTFQSHQLA